MTRDAEKPGWLRADSTCFLDARPRAEWVDLTPWGMMAVMRAAERDRVGGKDHVIGFQKKYARAKGFFGEVVHALACGADPLKTAGAQGLSKLDCGRCGAQVKATGEWSNPTLIVPEAQAPCALYALVAVDAAPWLRRDDDAPPPTGAVVWSAAREEVVRLAAEAAAHDEETFRWWYGRDAGPQLCVNWAQRSLDPAAWPGLALPPPLPTPAPPPAPDRGLAAEAVRQMRLTLRR